MKSSWMVTYLVPTYKRAYQALYLATLALLTTPNYLGSYLGEFRSAKALALAILMRRVV